MSNSDVSLPSTSSVCIQCHFYSFLLVANIAEVSTSNDSSKVNYKERNMSELSSAKSLEGSFLATITLVANKP